MKIKEIEMDLPYVKNEENIKEIQRKENLEHNEAIKRDYELNWKEKRRKFQLMTRCMTSMIERVLLPISTSDCWKIVIECVESSPENGYKNLLGVYTIQIIMNVEEFFQLNDNEKKRIVINKILECTNILSHIAKINLAGIEKACNEIITLNYNNEWYWKKPMKSKQGFVQIRLHHEVKELSIYMVFWDLYCNIIKQTHIVSTLPDERVYSRYLGKLE